MSLRITPILRFIKPATNLQRIGIGVTAAIMALSSLLAIPPQNARADYSTYADNPSSTIGTRTTYNGAPGLAFDSAGNSYFSITGAGNDYIRVVSPTNTFVRDIIPYEPNLAYGSFGPPITISTITVDTSNNVYAALGGNRIDKYTNDGTYIRTIGGAGSGDGQFGTIGQMTTDSSGNLYVVDKTANRIQKFDSNGNFLLKFGSFGSGDSQFNQIADLEVDPSDNLFVADGNNKRVKKFNSSGTFLLKFGAVNSAIGCPTFPSFNTLKSVTIDSSGTVYVGASTTGLCNIYVQRFDANGTYLGNFSLLSNPSRVKMNRAQNKLYSQEIRTYDLLSRYSNTGTYLDDIGHRLAAGNFMGDSTYIQDRVAQDSSGNTYIIDSDGNYRIQKFDNTGAYVSSFGAFGSGDGQFRRITGITLSPSGQLYVADALRHDIQVFSTSGTFVSKFGSSGSGDGQFASDAPGRMQFASNGDLYVIDGSTGLFVAGRIIVFDSSNIFKKNITNYQLNGQTVDFGSTLLNFALTSDDTLVILTYGSQYKLLRITSGGAFVDEKTLSNLTGENTNHIFYSSTTRLYVDHNDTIYLTGTETNSPATSLLQRPILAAINLDVPGIPDFRYVKSLDSTQDAVHFSANNSLQRWSSRFNYLSTYDITGTVSSPSAPQNLTASSPARGQITASWAAPASSGGGPVLGYRIDYKAHGSTNWTKHTTTTGTTDTIIHLPTDTYDVRISAYNLAGLGAPTTLESINVTGVSNPSAPQNLSVTSSALGTATATWQYPSDDGGETITTYQLEYRPHNINQWFLYSSSINATTATLTGLLDDDYDVRVSAINSSGTGTATTSSNHPIDNTYGYKEKLDVLDGGYIQGVTFDATGKRYESDYYYDRINVYDNTGTYAYSFGTSGSDVDQLYSPRQGAISSDNHLYIPDSGNNRVQIYALDGTHIGSFGTSGTGDGEMSTPTQVYIDASDTVYVVSDYTNIQKYDKNGTYLGRIATDAAAPVSMTMDTAGNIFVANASYDADHGIIKYASDGTTRLDHIGAEGAAPGQMYEVYGMAVNDNNQLIISDTYNNRLQTFNSDGSLAQVIGNGNSNPGEYLAFSEPLTLTRSSNGDIYIPDGYSPYMQVLSYTGKTETTTPPTPPTTPMNVTADASTPQQLTIHWDAPSSDGGSPITGYVIKHKQSTEDISSWTTSVADSTARQYTLTNLSAACYDVRVSATNSNGDSSPVSLSCTQVTDPPAPAVPTPPTPSPSAPTASPSDNPATNAPASPSHVSQPSSNASQQDHTPPRTDSAPTATLVAAAVNNDSPTKNVSLSWQTPQGESQPDRYVIEYRDSSIPESDTTTPWRQIGRVSGTELSTEITLPPGSYSVRVAAVFPGESPRIILGVARVTVSRSAGSNLSHQSSTTTDAPQSVSPWIVACTTLLAVAIFVFVPFMLWKKRKRQKEQQAKLPPRWQNPTY